MYTYTYTRSRRTGALSSRSEEKETSERENNEGNETANAGVRAIEKERRGVDGSGGCKNARRVKAGGTRVDRVAKTTGSQVIIKCNQYFTYFSRKSEGCLP